MYGLAAGGRRTEDEGGGGEECHAGESGEGRKAAMLNAIHGVGKGREGRWGGGDGATVPRCEGSPRAKGGHTECQSRCGVVVKHLRSLAPFPLPPDPPGSGRLRQT